MKASRLCSTSSRLRDRQQRRCGCSSSPLERDTRGRIRLGSDPVAPDQTFERPFAFATSPARLARDRRCRAEPNVKRQLGLTRGAAMFSIVLILHVQFERGASSGWKVSLNKALDLRRPRWNTVQQTVK